jgi:hypothetical protein
MARLAKESGIDRRACLYLLVSASSTGTPRRTASLLVLEVLAAGMVRSAGPALAGRWTTTRRLPEPAARGHVLRRWGWGTGPCTLRVSGQKTATGSGKPVSSCSPSRGKDRRDEEEPRSRGSGSRAVARQDSGVDRSDGAAV